MIHKSDSRKGKTKKQNRRLGYSESPSTLRSKEKEKPTTVRSMYPGYEHHSRYKQIESWNLISGINGNSVDALINLSGFYSVTASVAFISDMIWSKKKLAFHSSNMTFIFALH